MRTRGWLAFALVALPLLLAGVNAGAAVVRGVASYRGNAPIPPDARFEALLEDVTRPGNAVVVARAKINQPPTGYIPFQILYAPDRIQSNHAYAVRARIAIGDRLVFVSEQPVPVLTRGAGNSVNLSMRTVSLSSDPDLGRRGTLDDLPASFTGLLPCNDCAGVREHLVLMPDGTYLFGRTFMRTGHDETFYDIGSWVASSDGSRLVLRGQREKPDQLEVRNDATLRRLGENGRPTEPVPANDLHRAESLQPIEPRLPMSGIYKHAAKGAGTFRDCLTGQQWPLLPADPESALPTAWKEAKRKTGGEAMAYIEGRLVLHMRDDGATERSLVVERVIGFKPKETCGTVFVSAPLEGTRWQLAELDGEAVAPAEPSREAWITLQAKDHRASGSGGCNRISGSYQLTGNQVLSFGAMAATKKACESGMDVESKFLAALEATRSYVVVGRSLELLDESGQRRARLDAVKKR